jgi:hypothetical protein
MKPRRLFADADIAARMQSQANPASLRLIHLKCGRAIKRYFLPVP